MKNGKLYIQGLYMENKLNRGVLYPDNMEEIDYIECNYFNEDFCPTGICNIFMKN